MPSDDYLEDLEILGIIHTQPDELDALTPFDACMLSQRIAQNKDWDVSKSIVMTIAFTTGSCSLTTYGLTPEGYTWGKSQKEATTNDKGYLTSMFHKSQMILSDKFLGFFMVPDNKSWNYNFMGVNFSENNKYALILDNPFDFYHEAHRQSHFLDFSI
jgi:pre-mRNA-processing factor 8